MLDELVSSLLYEGYALYPYTPGATKNATPTPFGIVYPPKYAEECAGAFDHLRLECVAAPGPEATLSATLRYLEPSGERHEAVERHVEVGPVSLGEKRTVQFPAGRLTLRSESLPEPGRVLVRACVHNTEQVPGGLDRAAALTYSLISTHVVVKISDGCFISPLESGRRSVNIWPVLATPADDAILGAAIVLPDHPQIAPESRGNLFDNTEIEEALTLHVHTLTDSEREHAAAQDPVVREMLERALAVTPAEIMSLHGGMKDVPPAAGTGAPAAGAGTPPRGAGPPTVDSGMPWAGHGMPTAGNGLPGADDNPGEERATVGGITFERGASVTLLPGTDRDPYDRMLHGRRATIERIYVDYDDRVHLAVTVDDDPGRDLMRETGRYLFFFAHEVEKL
jgi:hypothetical protein